MKSYLPFVLAFAALLCTFSCTPKPFQEGADLIFKNGQIYTVDPDRRSVQAMALIQGRIVALGSDSSLNAFITEGTEVIDLGGKLVLPGFFDSHAHPVSATKQLYEANLYNLHGITEIQAALKAFRADHPEAKLIKGRGWSNADFPKRGPDKKDIDAVIDDIPVSLSDEGGHAKWVNSKTLELAGIDEMTIDPAGGVVERYEASREPSGALREDAAGLVADLFPYYGFEELKKGLLAYQEMALAFGMTAAHDAYLDVGIDEVPAYRSLEKENLLKMRFRAGLYVDPDQDMEQIQALIDERDADEGQLFRINSAKIFIDGVVEGSTGYLNESYDHLPDSKGKLLWDVERLNRVSAQLDQENFQIHVHAIGDGATRVMLDALEYVQSQNGIRDSRHAITHLQLVSPKDILRFHDLGVVALPQPYWFKKDSYYYNIQVPYLGLERADHEYPMASFFNAGVKVASSSDYPVTIPCNPLIAIELGMTRQEIGTRASSDVLWPEERVSLAEMIESFTINGAYADFLEAETGSLEVGKSADFILLDRNLFQIPVTEIHQVQVLATYFQGKPVFKSVRNAF
ncbi:MAG: amidohydrolase [Candidatus Marinimicrobia bacterium]|nr:amidohydrolase [Candidatus Neomarinimicrobiota bacterium]